MLGPRMVMAGRRVVRRRLARGTFPVGNGAILTTNTDGRVLFLDEEDETITPAVLTRRIYEPGTSRLLCRLVRPGDRVLDIGANIGWFTLLAAERVGPMGVVHAFEPQPRLATLLHRSVFANGLDGRCTLHQIALGTERGRADLYVVQGKFGGGRLLPITEGELAWMNAKEASTVSVEVRQLDEVLAADPHVDLIKIDVEGFERPVFDGASEVFKASPMLKMITEFVPQVHGEEMLDFLRSAGFVLHRIGRFGQTRAVHDDRDLMSEVVVNLFAARPG
jgi:FkbM family methyltransferase